MTATAAPLIFSAQIDFALACAFVAIITIAFCAYDDWRSRRAVKAAPAPKIMLTAKTARILKGLGYEFRIEGDKGRVIATPGPKAQAGMPKRAWPLDRVETGALSAF